MHALLHSRALHAALLRLAGRLDDRHAEALVEARDDQQPGGGDDTGELVVGDVAESVHAIADAEAIDRLADRGLIGVSGADDDQVEVGLLSCDEGERLEHPQQVLAGVGRADDDDVRAATDDGGRRRHGVPVLLAHAGVGDRDPLRGDTEVLDEVALGHLRDRDDAIGAVADLLERAQVRLARARRDPLGEEQRDHVVDDCQPHATPLARAKPLRVDEGIDVAGEALEATHAEVGGQTSREPRRALDGWPQRHVGGHAGQRGRDAIDALLLGDGDGTDVPIGPRTGHRHERAEDVPPDARRGDAQRSDFPGDAHALMMREPSAQASSSTGCSSRCLNDCKSAAPPAPLVAR